MLHKPELRLKSGSRQDRSVKRKIYARTTDKGYANRRIYSLLSRYNKMKRELTYRMTMQATATDGGAALQNTPGTIDAIQITSVNRGTGAITGTVVQGAPQSSWGASDYLQVLGDIGIGGSSTIAGMLGLSGLAAWVPAVDPPSTDRHVVRVKFSLIDLEVRQDDRAQAKAA